MLSAKKRNLCSNSEEILYKTRYNGIKMIEYAKSYKDKHLKKCIIPVFGLMCCISWCIKFVVMKEDIKILKILLM